jgi:hypothetical protein
VAETEQLLELINHQNELLGAVQAPRHNAVQAVSIASELLEQCGAIRGGAFTGGIQRNKTGSQRLERKRSWSQEAYVSARVAS